MNVLYVVGANLTRNTSANMSHNGYVQGLIDNGCNVDILMQTNSWGQQDVTLKRFDKARYFEYESESLPDKIRKRFSQTVNSTHKTKSEKSNDLDCHTSDALYVKCKRRLRQLVKATFYLLFPQDSLYPLDKTWLKNALNFRGRGYYDIVISNSSPSASHKMVEELLKKNRITCSRWIQIWEDPWYYDIYGKHDDKIKLEEHRLLQAGSEVYYVSPLTLHYQKEIFSDCAHKFKYIALPAFKYELDTNVSAPKLTYGYFGDYYSNTRNLLPFYEALKDTENYGCIYGDSDLSLQPTDKIEISTRVTLDTLSKVQARTSVLVHLCNLKGGQIPGKIYHYSVTNKPILFILDGTDDEVRIIKEHFSQFNRYIFCDNNVASIKEALAEIAQLSDSEKFRALDCYNPREVVKNIL